MDEVYIEGILVDNNLFVPGLSVAVLYLLHYCKSTNIKVCFLTKNKENENKLLPICIPSDVVQGLQVSFMEIHEAPDAIQQCAMPAIYMSKHKVLSGLCCVLRRIVKASCGVAANETDLLKLLSHKENCLKACAEVSVWTKFCEVEMPNIVDQILQEKADDSSKIQLPAEMLKLENHFKQPVSVANISKRKHEVRKQKQQKVSQSRSETVSEVEEQMADVDLTDSKSGSGCTLDDLQHNFVEGLDFTLADLVLYPLISCILNFWRPHLVSLQRYLPLTYKWYHRLSNTDRIRITAKQCHLPCLVLPSAEYEHHDDSCICLPLVDIEQLNIREPKRRKFKSKLVDISKSMQKVQNISLENVCGDHPCDNVQLPWQHLPESVHPKDGDLPCERLERKCQQLENLAQAVVTMARPGQTIVDFCSGGGHLGILLAYLLPKCKIILVENKEESIQKAERRIQSLKLENIFIYQCNLDYFCGRFDIGTCLHACGVATDLVLQCCIDKKASFVICPCCYGGIQNKHTVTYPRSCRLQQMDVSYKEYLCLGHAADRTEINIPAAKQGKQCMVYIDTDRAALAQEHGYKVTLTTLQPAECSPKNNLLIGTKLS